MALKNKQWGHSSHVGCGLCHMFVTQLHPSMSSQSRDFPRNTGPDDHTGVYIMLFTVVMVTSRSSLQCYNLVKLNKACYDFAKPQVKPQDKNV